jgi:hypothetical protein
MTKLDQREWCAWSPRADGTEKPDSFKLLMTLFVGDRERFYGSAGFKFVELMRMRPARAPVRKVQETAT